MKKSVLNFKLILIRLLNFTKNLVKKHQLLLAIYINTPESSQDMQQHTQFGRL